MARHPLNDVVLRLRATASVPTEPVWTDGELLERYLANRDDDAFEALVERHGPMVLAVCRRVADHPQDAEDAFQATFLVLVRKAATIRPRNLVGNWLYGVAYRAGLKVRALSNRQKTRERPMSKIPEPATIESSLWEDLIPVLDQELDALPAKFRMPIVLCDLEGKTRKEAAQHLNWPEGTVAGRLAQARAMLAKRLVKHGLPVSGGILVALLAQKGTAATVPLTLAAKTLLVSATAAAAASSRVALVADAVIKSMLLGKLKTLTAMLVALAAFVLSGALLTQVIAESLRDDAPVVVRPVGDAKKIDDKAKDRQRLDGTWRRVSVEMQGRKNALYKNYEPYLLIEPGKLTTTDHLDQIERKGDLQIDTAESALDWLITDGPGKGTTLLLRYELLGDTLRIAWDETARARPSEMTTKGDSTFVIFTYQRETPPRVTGVEALQGAWNVVAHQTLGKEASPEFLEHKHQWIFAGNAVTMRDKDEIGRTGTFQLDPSTLPRAMDLTMNAGLPAGPRGAPPKAEKSQCIYVLKEDVLTICYGDASQERPKWFLSTFNLRTSVVTLKRDAAKVILPDKKAPAVPGKAAIPSLEEIAGAWHLNGNGFTGDLVLDVSGGKIEGRMYTQGITGAYDAKAGRIVLNRFEDASPKLGNIVQIYTGDIIRGDEPGPAYSLKGSFQVVGAAKWGAEGVEYHWHAVRHCDHVKTMSINRIMQAAHLTPGNRSTKNNLDNKVIDGKASKAEQQQLLDLYEELSRREPPQGEPKVWKERTAEMVVALKAVVAGENGAAARLTKARDCKACHDAHRQAALPEISKEAALADLGGSIKPGSKMPKLVVDFLTGPKAGGSGCPSVMISNSRMPGIILWCPSGADEIYELAAALEKQFDSKKSQGYLVVFSSKGKGSMSGKASRFGLQSFNVGVPRGGRDETHLFARAVDGKAEAIVFVVDALEIRGVWPVDSQTLGRERVQAIVNEVSVLMASPSVR